MKLIAPAGPHNSGREERAAPVPAAQPQGGPGQDQGRWGESKIMSEKLTH